MKYRLVMLKERYDALQNKMSEKVFFTKDSFEDDGTHWVHFEVEIEGAFDLLDVFHAGYHAGYDYGVNIFKPKYD